MAHLPTKPLHPTIICTVDIVLLTLQHDRLHVALLTRSQAPYAGILALPGGYIHAQEDATAWDAARRVLQAKTGLDNPYLEQLATYSGAQRDPRGWSLSISYYALVAADQCTPLSLLATHKNPASTDHLPQPLQLHAVDQLPELAFDHASIISLAVDKIRHKSLYSSLPVYLCGERFTLPRLQAVYEAVLGEPINKVSFRRKIDELGMLEPIPGVFEAGAAHRPAQVYTLRPAYRRTLAMVPRGINT